MELTRPLPYSRLLLAVVVASAAVIVPACDTPARTIDPSKEGIVRANRIDVQDFEVAAGQMLDSLYTSGALERAPRKPAVLAFSRIINDTGEQFDTDLLTVRITEQLQNGGKAVLSTTMGNQPRDPMAQDTARRNEFLADQPTASTAGANPDFTLIGKILKSSARAGDMRQSTYTFQLMLTDTRQGVTVWQAQRQITKQGTKSAVGL